MEYEVRILVAGNVRVGKDGEAETVPRYPYVILRSAAGQPSFSRSLGISSKMANICTYVVNANPNSCAYDPGFTLSLPVLFFSSFLVSRVVDMLRGYWPPCAFVCRFQFLQAFQVDFSSCFFLRLFGANVLLWSELSCPLSSSAYLPCASRFVVRHARSHGQRTSTPAC
jgi:hypothetical protein